MHRSATRIRTVFVQALGDAVDATLMLLLFAGLAWVSDNWFWPWEPVGLFWASLIATVIVYALAFSTVRGLYGLVITRPLDFLRGSQPSQGSYEDRQIFRRFSPAENIPTPISFAVAIALLALGRSWIGVTDPELTLIGFYVMVIALAPLFRLPARRMFPPPPGQDCDA